MDMDTPLCHKFDEHSQRCTCSQRRAKRRQKKGKQAAHVSVLYTHMFAPIAQRFAIRHTITLMLSLTRSSPAVVMAAVGTVEGDFSGVIPKAERCEMWSRSESSKWEGKRRRRRRSRKKRRNLNMLFHRDPKPPGNRVVPFKKPEILQKAAGDDFTACVVRVASCASFHLENVFFSPFSSLKMDQGFYLVFNV